MKVLRWAVFLSQFQYRIEHVDGDDNTMAYIMIRCMCGYRGKHATIRRVTYRILENAYVPFPESKNFEWPTVNQMRKAKVKHAANRRKEATQEGNFLCRFRNYTWVPDQADDLQLRLLIVAHCGTAGHHSTGTIENVLREQFTWSTLKEGTREFVVDSIHCLMAKPDLKISRPLVTTFHATSPSDGVQFDYLNVKPVSWRNRFILVVKDDLTGYVSLRKAESSDAASAASVLASWIRMFSAINVWVSDQGSHYEEKRRWSLKKRIFSLFFLDRLHLSFTRSGAV